MTEDDQRHLSVTGGLAIGQTDLYLEQVAWDQSGPCMGKTTGTIWIREPTGYWYSWALGDDCDGCGEIRFSDSLDMGEVCLDLAYLEETALRVVPGKQTAMLSDTGEVTDSGDVP